MPNGIIVCGMNGAGKSTLAKALAEEINWRFIDIEDIYFPKDNPDYLYSNPRSFEDVQSILYDIILSEENFVLASLKGNFSEKIVSSFKYAVFIDTPKDIRLKRVYERSYCKFGDRILVDGDLYEREKSFFDLVKSRDEKMVKNWLSSLSCPIIRVNGTLSISDNIKSIVQQL